MTGSMDNCRKARRFRAGRILALALAAALSLSAGPAAHAADREAAAQEAEQAALREIEVWKQMGLLCPEVSFEGSADAVVEIPGWTGGESWYGRRFAHSYDVRWYIPTPERGDQAPAQRKYGGNLSIDARSGKILAAYIDAGAGADAAPVREDVRQVPADPEDPESELIDAPIYFYDNFGDIFPADMTVDRFCTLLAEYWGFGGYRLAETVDDMYFDAPQPPVDPDSLLKDMNADTRANYYLTVFFEGDQPGAPMYVQLHQFPSYVTLTVGTGHAVG